MRIISIILILIVFCACGLPAQNAISPQSGMKIVGYPAVINFRWEDDGSMYYLEVYSASGYSIFSQPVKGGVFALALKPNDYKWRVKKFYEGRYIEGMEFVTFSIFTDMQFAFDGQNGSPGASGVTGRGGESWEDGRYAVAGSGAGGGSGNDGENGRDVSVILQDSGDFVKVLVISGSESKDFLLAKSSGPIAISSNGGSGGDGGSGGSGGNVISYGSGYQDPYSTQRRYTGPGGSGGSGGNGGDGGSGGKVTVNCATDELRKYVQASVKGGKGGRGGSGGRGGEPGGASGSPGNEGHDGPSGSVIYE